MSGSLKILSDFDNARVELPFLVLVISLIAIFLSLYIGQILQAAVLPQMMLPYIR